jgi:predicted porin
LQVLWAGARYQVTRRLETMIAWNHYEQNSYKGNGCSDTSFASCSGRQNTLSLILDYHLTKAFDAYAGAMYSQVLGGFENGFFHNNNIDPTIGMRYVW